jgi:hypothetical protein
MITVGRVLFLSNEAFKSALNIPALYTEGSEFERKGVVLVAK